MFRLQEQELEHHYKMSISRVSDIEVKDDLRGSTVRVKASSGTVRGTVAFTSRLNQDNSINKAGAGVRGWAHSETGTLDVTPVTPLAPDVLNTRTTLIDDEVSGESGT